MPGELLRDRDEPGLVPLPAPHKHVCRIEEDVANDEIADLGNPEVGPEKGLDDDRVPDSLLVLGVEPHLPLAFEVFRRPATCLPLRNLSGVTISTTERFYPARPSVAGPPRKAGARMLPPVLQATMCSAGAEGCAVALSQAPTQCYVQPWRLAFVAQTAFPPTVRPSVLPLWDFEAALRRLPAELRATVAWTKAPALAALARLESEPLTDHLLEDVGMALGRPLVAVTSALWKALASRDAWQSELESALRQDTALMNQFLADTDARETLAWCLGIVRSLVGLTSIVNMDVLERLHEEELASVVQQPQFVLLMKGQAALLGALQVARNHGDPGRAAELLEAAFMFLCELQDRLRQDGLWLNPFVGESPDERAERTLRYARQAREALSEDDAETLDAGRLRTLR